jgi:hypothetical protein
MLHTDIKYISMKEPVPFAIYIDEELILHSEFAQLHAAVLAQKLIMIACQVYDFSAVREHFHHSLEYLGMGSRGK